MNKTTITTQKIDGLYLQIHCDTVVEKNQLPKMFGFCTRRSTLRRAQVLSCLLFNRTPSLPKKTRSKVRTTHGITGQSEFLRPHFSFALLVAIPA